MVFGSGILSIHLVLALCSVFVDAAVIRMAFAIVGHTRLLLLVVVLDVA